MFQTILSALLAICAISCASWVRDRDLNEIINFKRSTLAQSSVLILNLKEPDHARGAGALTAELFHQEILKTKKFKLAMLSNHSQWDRLENSEENRLLHAMTEGEEKGVDYVLAGEVREFYNGGLTNSRVIIRVRLIEISTRSTVYLAEKFQKLTSKDGGFSMDASLAEKAGGAEQASAMAIRTLVKRM